MDEGSECRRIMCFPTEEKGTRKRGWKEDTLVDKLDLSPHHPFPVSLSSLLTAKIKISVSLKSLSFKFRITIVARVSYCRLLTHSITSFVLPKISPQDSWSRLTMSPHLLPNSPTFGCDFGEICLLVDAEDRNLCLWLLKRWHLYLFSRKDVSSKTD